MKVRILLVTALTGGLAFGWTTAAAKGAQRLTLTGPGLATPIQLTNSPESVRAMHRIAEHAGLYKYGSDRVLAHRPAGDLGPRYVATYDLVIAQSTTTPLCQEMYPFAAGGAVVYTPPGQRVGGGTRRPARWYQAGTELTMRLVAVGVPVPTSFVMPVPVVDAPRLTG
jgi:hypothetical protein